jgi:O-acetyl-ADP-ribose deacetylase (regulator of RNase III)
MVALPAATTPSAGLAWADLASIAVKSIIAHNANLPKDCTAPKDFERRILSALSDKKAMKNYLKNIN